MNLSAPQSVVMSETEGVVLKLLSRVTVSLSGREVARLGGAPKTSVSRALKRLVEHGLVEARSAGSGVVTLYTFNRDHLAAEPVLALLELRRALVQRLEREFQSWQILPCHASLFGSGARGDGGTDSDIDILVVRPAGIDAEVPTWRQQVFGLQGQVLRWTGNHAGIAEVSIEELDRLRRERPPIVVELERDGVTLFGAEVRRLLSREPA